MNKEKTDMFIYTTEDGLFQRDKTTIPRHIKIYLRKVNYSAIQLLQILQQLRLMGKHIR